MLIRFSFKNFKSFKDENLLDMEATALKEHEYNIAKTENIDLLKVAAIYGANASGKTNVLQAFDYMRLKVLIDNKIRHEMRIEEKSINSFMINEEPISVEVEILAKNQEIYKYGFELSKEKVISEWLYKKRINTFYEIFEREGNNVNLKINKNKFSNIDENSLFLNMYSRMFNDNEDFTNVFNWFANTNFLDFGNSNFENFITQIIRPNFLVKILEDEKYKKEMIKFINAFDNGIKDIRITPSKKEKIQNVQDIKMELIHENENKDIALPLELESSGTVKMINMFDFLMNALKEGTVIFIDELDAKLHPLLTRYIINLFHNSETNIGNGQLIYSTHDTVNLNKDTFRRDEIWFAEKDKDGISEIYALSDYILEDDKNAGKKVRNDATYNKDYLTGRYGAIPVLKEFSIV